MCGITTIIKIDRAPCDAAVVAEMTELVRHRGPDGSGIQLFEQKNHTFSPVASDNPNWQVGLGHRRLAILDLSDAGRQPMSYRSRYWITFNGEIYNYIELRIELERLGHQFHTGTDTEVALAAFVEWGTDCFERFRGMWGMVLLDLERGVAVASRDRLGIKPLYWARVGGLIAIVSEIKQLSALPGFRFRRNDVALWEYVLTGDEESCRTLFAGVEPMASGTWQEINLTTGQFSPAVSFWHPESIQPDVFDRREAAARFREALMDSTRIHLRSDVPVGCALSGGLDSSAIAVCATHLAGPSAERLHTFSVTFPNHPRDESAFIRIVAERIQAHTHSVTPSPEELLEDLDRFVWIHDEPVGGLPQYAAYAVARLTREAGVPVSLNGQGGDELLGGYWQSYFVYLKRQLTRGHAARVGAQLVGALTPSGNYELVKQIPVILKRYRHRKAAGHRWRVRGDAEAAYADTQKKLKRLMSCDDQARRIYEIREVFLPRLLKWDDRNFMAFAIEGRYPFLDHKMIEVALSFAPDAMYHRGWTKEPLRRGLEDLLPKEITRRRTKWGFPTPQVDWVNGPLRKVLEDFVRNDSPLWELLEQRQVAEFADYVWADRGAHDNPPYELFRIFLLDRWLRRFDVAA